MSNKFLWFHLEISDSPCLYRPFEWITLLNTNNVLDPTMQTLLSIFIYGCVQQDARPQGFISLHPSVTETFYALGAETQLIGRSDYCEYPSIAKNLSTYGTALTPNFEKISAANAEGVVGDHSLSQHSEALKQMGSVQALPWLSIEDMKTSIGTLGSLTNTSEKALQIQSDLATTFDNTYGGEPVLLLLSGSDVQKGQLWFIKPESIHGSILEASGYSNAVAKGAQIPQMSIEELLIVNPPIIAIIADTSSSQTDLNTKINQLKELTSLQAVQQKHICLLKIDNAFGTGPSIIDMVPKFKSQLTTCLK